MKGSKQVSNTHRFKRGVACGAILAIMLAGIMATAIPVQAASIKPPPANSQPGSNASLHRQNGTGIGVSLNATGTLVNQVTTTFDITSAANPTSLDLILGGDPGQFTDSINVTSHSSTALLGGVKGSVKVVNGGGADTQDLTVRVVLLAQGKWGGFQTIKTQTVDVSAKPVIPTRDMASYAYTVEFPPVNGARAYKVTAYVTITNHSGRLGTPFGPSPSHGFQLPQGPTGTIYSPWQVDLSDNTTVPDGLTVSTVSAFLNGVALADLAGPWMLNAPYASSYDLQIVKTVTPATAGTFDLTDVAAVAGRSSPAHVAVNVTAASIGGKVIDDLNGNGAADTGEPGIAGVTVTLEQAGVPLTSQVTDANGSYRFDALAPGDYTVTQAPPDGAQPIGTISIPVTLPPGGQITGVDFFDAYSASMAGKVVNDLNGNGAWDESEIGIPDVQVQVISDGVLLAASFTDADGNYSLTVLVPGTYTLMQIVPTGFTATSPASITQTVKSGEAITGLDFFDLASLQTQNLNSRQNK